MVDQTVSQHAQRCSINAILFTLHQYESASVCLRLLAPGAITDVSQFPRGNAFHKLAYYLMVSYKGTVFSLFETELN